MNFTMVKPCDNCPFLKKGGIRLRRERIKDIVDTLTVKDGTFTCHKTTVHVDSESGDGEGDREDGPNAQHCAGALIFCEKQGNVPQLVRIAERLGMYDSTKLVGQKKVFDSLSEFLKAAIDKAPKKRGTGEPCSVADPNCEHPAGWEAGGGLAENPDVDAPYTCDECGDPVCASCSGTTGKKRVCNYCSERVEARSA